MNTYTYSAGEYSIKITAKNVKEANELLKNIVQQFKLTQVTT